MVLCSFTALFPFLCAMVFCLSVCLRCLREQERPRIGRRVCVVAGFRGSGCSLPLLPREHVLAKQSEGSSGFGFFVFVFRAAVVDTQAWPLAKSSVLSR